MRDICEGQCRLKGNPLDEFQVAVEGGGEVIFCDAKQRLVAATICGYVSISVIVNLNSRVFLDRSGSSLTPREMAGQIRCGRGTENGVLGQRKAARDGAKPFPCCEPYGIAPVEKRRRTGNGLKQGTRFGVAVQAKETAPWATW